MVHRSRLSSTRGPRGGPGAREPAAALLEKLLSELSAAFLRVAPRDVDAEIERWLGRLARLLGGRVSILQMSPGGSSLHALHSASIDGVPPFPVVTTASEFTWLVEQVQSARVFQVEHLPTGLPASAEPERTWAAIAGLTAYALVPFAAGPSVRGAVALSTTRARRAWSEPVIGWLQLVADAIANALARLHASYALEERISFEHLLTDLVDSLLCPPVEELDTRIRHGLERVIGHFGIDRCSIARLSEDGTALSVTHGASAPGIPPARAAIEPPWMIARMREAIIAQRIPGRADLRGEAISDAQDEQEPGVRGDGRRGPSRPRLCSYLSIPLAVRGRPWGAIGFSAFQRPRRWRDDEAQRLGLVGGIVMDALIDREARETAQRERGALVHVARVAALGELTAALAHELNQPLMAIRANAQATRRVLRAGGPADVDEVLGDIAEDATRAGDLIKRLRDLLRRRELAKEVLDVNEAIGAVEAIARTEAHRHGAELVVEAGAGVPRVLGDAIQLQQVVLNLVRNGAEAMSGQAGRREVRIRTWGTAGEQVTVSVEDDGPPIDEATLSGMFTPFSTTKAEGLGIGLAISRSIVEAHAGRLWAGRRAGRGLAVRFALPAHAARAMASMLVQAPCSGEEGATDREMAASRCLAGTM
jgi:signal transduction histidine kinase